MPDDKAGEVIPYEELTLKQQLQVIEMVDQKVEKSEIRLHRLPDSATIPSTVLATA